jgi:cytochrome b561
MAKDVTPDAAVQPHRRLVQEKYRMMCNTDARWGTMAQALHWIAGALILVLIVHGWWMVEFAPRAERFGHYAWHASVGYGLLALMALRLLWRWMNAVPKMPAEMPRPLRAGAIAGHWGLYILAIAASVSGWALAGTFKRALDLTLFGWVRVPPLVTAQDRALHQQLESWHEQLAWALAIVVVIHVAGAMYHWRKKDGVMERMLPRRWARSTAR